MATGMTNALPRERLLREGGAVSQLLPLLWHTEESVRRGAALALAGGDRQAVYRPDYGHFAGSLLRSLLAQNEAQPETHDARYQAVMLTLRSLLRQSVLEIRGMGNMRYSFLSSALYLALLATCLDGVQAVRRLRVATAHTELCDLLECLSRLQVVRRLNPHDLEGLASRARATLAAFPAEEIPDFWHRLTSVALPLRESLAATLTHLQDTTAVPYLLALLPGQPLSITLGIVACLGRLGDVRALPMLQGLVETGERSLRRPAQDAIAAILRSDAESARQTLLRSAALTPDDDPAHLLRSAPRSGPTEPPEELLRLPVEWEREPCESR